MPSLGACALRNPELSIRGLLPFTDAGLGERYHPCD